MRYPNGSIQRPTVSSSFGPRPPGAGSTYHRGTDFIGFDQIRAVAGGRVVKVGVVGGWTALGRSVWIQHDGYFTKNGHMASYGVSVGDVVNEGDYLGAMDTTGTATGKHDHFELTPGTLHTSNTGQVDPVPFIAARLSAPGPAATDTTRKLQEALVRLGYQITVDGIYGPQTIGAVRDFQSKNPPLVVDGDAGPATWAVINQKLAAPIGGNQTTRPTAEIQKFVGANVDGIWGPETTSKVMAWQTSVGLTADGIWGPLSDAKAVSLGAFGPVLPPQIKVDGIWGSATTSAIQVLLGVLPVDGDRGPITVTAIQKATGNPNQDGEWGPQSSHYLRLSLGIPATDQPMDMRESDIRTLQEHLNAGKPIVPAGTLPPPPDPTEPTNTNPPFTPEGALPRTAWTAELLSGEALIPVDKSVRTGFIVHWDGNATPTTVEQEKQFLRNYEAYHRTQAGGLAGGLKYNLAVGPVSGDVYVGRGLENRGMHTGGNNIPLIGVILIGGPGNLTDKGMEGLRKAYRIAQEYVGHDLAQWVHSDKNSTECPGDAIRNWVKAGGLNDVPDPDPGPDPTPDPEVYVVPKAVGDEIKALVGEAFS